MKKFIYLLGIGITVLLVQFAYGKLVPEKSVSANVIAENSLEKVFQNNNIHKADCEIEGYYYLGEKYYGESGSLELIDKIAERLGVNSEYYYDKYRTDTGTVAVMKKDGKSSELELELITTEYQESQNVIAQRNYLSVSLDIKDSLESGYYYKKLIEKTMKEICREESNVDENINKDEEVTTSIRSRNIYMVIKGKIYGEIDKEQENKIAKGILKSFQAKKIFNGQNDEHMNVYGYTEILQDYVAIGSEKININVAFSYDEQENITYVYIGSPIVNYDY
ncbi:MAG: YwmB family TATA-box binding protein [Lachnospiraceae bacterium]|nr:YwmB family TATA-box binding protein [Lachnospiraceae bacterium]